MNPNPIRAVFVDLDGTLLRGVNTVTPRTIAAFERIRAIGILPVIATGRLAYDANDALHAIGADRYLIAMNGLEIYDDYRSGHLLSAVALEPSTAERLLTLCLREQVFFHIYARNRAYCQADCAPLLADSGMDQEHIDYYASRQNVVSDLRRELTSAKLNKFFVCTADPNKFQRIKAGLQQIPGVQAHFPCPHYIDILPEGADKRFAVRTVREALGLTAEQVMAIGDSDNDLGMFEEAGLRVAMGNACEPLKRRADVIAPDNGHDGVAWSLETLLL